MSSYPSLSPSGVVYNVTEFARYHPGGKTQLMRGAGQDCTELFDKVRREEGRRAGLGHHRWVGGSEVP